MATLMRIAGWNAVGLHCPDHEVSFLTADGDVSPITLIQMPNGTGKTTTLALLRTALSGEAADNQWDKTKIRSFRKRANDHGRGMFRVILIHNGQRLTITMTFDFEEGIVRYSTTVSSGIKDGFHPPRDLGKFLRPEFVKFFVFDGELAEQLLSHDHTNAQTVIEDLFQLGLFSSLANHVREYWEQETAHRGATEDRGLSRRRNRVDMLRQRIAALKAEQARTLTQYEEAKQELLKKRNRFNAALTAQRELGERLRRAESELTRARASVETAAGALLGLMRNAHALSSVFAQEMITLKGSLDRVKLPESTAREFFEELAQEPRCVCGRDLDDETRKAIRERASQYLGSDDVALLNSIKGDVADIIGTDPDVHETALNEQSRSLLDNCRRETELRTARDRIQTEGVANDPTLEQAKQDIEQLEQKVRGHEEALHKYDDMTETAGDDDTYGIRVLERRLTDAENKLAEISHTLALKSKRDILARLLESAQAKARSGISREICIDANARVEELMPDNAIRIQEVNRCLILRGQEGGSIRGDPVGGLRLSRHPLQPD